MDNLIQAIIMKMVVMVDQLMEMVVVELLQGHLVEQEMVLDMQEVLAHQVDHQDLDLEVEVVQVLVDHNHKQAIVDVVEVEVETPMVQHLVELE